MSCYDGDTKGGAVLDRVGSWRRSPGLAGMDGDAADEHRLLARQPVHDALDPADPISAGTGIANWGDETVTPGETMTHTEPFGALRLRKEAAQERHHRLTELGHQWDHTIRAELQRLARALWPNGHVLDQLSVHRVRLRYQVEGETLVWWLERDIPPYDLFRCQAYRVTLALDAGDEPVLTVESGAGAITVAPLSVEALEAALAQAGETPPVLIPRTRGEAVY
jgi:hypothetical protein